MTGILLCGTFDKIEINDETRDGGKEIVTCRERNRIMNVLIINASPRKKGITSTLLDEVKTVINPTYDRYCTNTRLENNSLEVR